MSTQWDARFTGIKLEGYYATPTRCWNRITVFSTADRQDAIAEVIKATAAYGYSEVTVDHMVRIGK